MDLKEAIRLSYLAEGLSIEGLESLYNIARLTHFHDGDAILMQFEYTRDLYILANGSVRVQTASGEPLGLIMPGMPMGEISFLDGRPRSGTATASGNCDVVVLPFEPLMAILKEYPVIAAQILWNISSVLCSRLRTANNNNAGIIALDEFESNFTKL